MKLALRKQPPQDAVWWQLWFAKLTKWRLVSEYSHGGIVIGDLLYHVTSERGLHVTSYTPEKWDIFDIGGDDYKALNTFKRMKGTKYDYIGLLAFIAPWNVNSKRRMYCFEWCAHLMGLDTHSRITPELLLVNLYKQKHLSTG